MPLNRICLEYLSSLAILNSRLQATSNSILHCEPTVQKWPFDLYHKLIKSNEKKFLNREIERRCLEWQQDSLRHAAPTMLSQNEQS